MSDGKELLKKAYTVLPNSPQFLRNMHSIGSILELLTKQQIMKIKLVDQGYLINSIKYKVETGKDFGLVSIGSYGVKYAAIHELGGVIRPVNARALTIPASPWAKHHRARDFKLIRIENMLVDPNKMSKTGGTRSVLIPRNAIGFWLVKSSKIRAKHYMRDAVETASPRILRILSKMGGAE